MTDEELRAVVLQQEQSREDSDPEGATEAWTALVSGRWSLVDRFEHGERRYLVARRNQLVNSRGLSERERGIGHLAALGKSNKVIAYELGLAESTVGTHLSAVMRKLGVTSRVELIRLLAGFAHG